MNNALLASLPAEAQLLLACARCDEETEVGARLEEALRQPFDWSYFLDLVWRHEIHPLAAAYLGRLDGALLPAEVATLLRTRRVSVVLQNLLLTAELLRIVRHLSDHRVEAISFKGPLLAFTAYGNVGLREHGDLDLLLRRKDLERAQALLVELGYAPRDELSSAERARRQRVTYAYPYVRTDGPHTYIVELHWHFFPEYMRWAEYDVAGVWRRRRLVPIDAHALPGLSPEDAVLLLCIHGCKHRWSALKWLVDLHRFAASQPVDWDVVLQRAEQAGAKRMLGLSFYLANRLLGTPLPLQLLPLIDEDRRIEGLARQVVASIPSDAQPSLRDVTLFRAEMSDRHRRRWRYLWDTATRPTPAEWEQVRLPAFLSGFYRWYRPVRLLGILFNRLRESLAGSGSAR